MPFFHMLTSLFGNRAGTRLKILFKLARRLASRRQSYTDQANEQAHTHQKEQRP